MERESSDGRATRAARPSRRVTLNNPYTRPQDNLKRKTPAVGVGADEQNKRRNKRSTSRSSVRGTATTAPPAAATVVADNTTADATASSASPSSLSIPPDGQDVSMVDAADAHGPNNVDVVAASRSRNASPLRPSSSGTQVATAAPVAASTTTAGSVAPLPSPSPSVPTSNSRSPSPPLARPATAATAATAATYLPTGADTLAAGSDDAEKPIESESPGEEKENSGATDDTNEPAEDVAVQANATNRMSPEEENEQTKEKEQEKKEQDKESQEAREEEKQKEEQKEDEGRQYDVEPALAAASLTAPATEATTTVSSLLLPSPSQPLHQTSPPPTRHTARLGVGFRFALPTFAGEQEARYRSLCTRALMVNVTQQDGHPGDYLFMSTHVMYGIEMETFAEVWSGSKNHWIRGRKVSMDLARYREICRKHDAAFRLAKDRDHHGSRVRTAYKMHALSFDLDEFESLCGNLEIWLARARQGKPEPTTTTKESEQESC